MRQFFSDPYAWETDHMFTGKRLAKPAKKFLRHLLPYFTTPVRALGRELGRREVDLILCQEYEYARFDIVTALGRVLHLPVFATFQGGSWQVSKLERITRPWSVRQCAGLIIGPASEATRVQAVYRLAPDKIARLPNPLDLTEWEPIPRGEARRRLSLPLTARIAISHGRIDIFRKGLDVLVEAWSEIRANNPSQDWRLILIGSGDDASEFRKMLRDRGDSSVLWIDQYLRDRVLMRTWLSAADVYVMASRHEGFPVAPLEAMACGLPVIAAAAPGIAEIMGGKEPLPGLTVPTADANSLSGALEKLLGDILLSQELGILARKHAEDFSLASVSERLGDFLLARSGIANRTP
jgi:starch synthase